MLLFFALIFISYEMLQLVLAERYIGIKKIRAGVHPLESNAQGPAWIATAWLLGMLSSWVFIVYLLFQYESSIQGFLMVLTSVAGMSLRRSLGIKWALVIMTIEGAIRMGLLANLMITAIFAR